MGDFGTLDSSDPQFLERAAEEPSMLDYVGDIAQSFGEGLVSWPFDFTLCMHWIAGTSGLYGSRVQQNCNYHTRRILTVIRYSGQAAHYLIFKGVLFKVLGSDEALHQMREAISRVSGPDVGRTFVDALPRVSTMAARSAGRWVSGTAFTSWMETRGRIAVPSRRARWGIFAFNFLALLWGSAINVSAKHPGNFDITSVFYAWITGDPKLGLSDEEYMALFRAAQQAADSVLRGPDYSDFRMYQQALDTLHRFGVAGGRDR